jgi:hypothetical protein
VSLVALSSTPTREPTPAAPAHILPPGDDLLAPCISFVFERITVDSLD